MKFPQGANRIGRVIGIITFLVPLFFLGMLLAASALSGVLIQGLTVILPLGAFWVSLGWWALSEFPVVELTEEGIAFRILLRRRCFLWKDILQAGILWRRGKNSMYNELVLVIPGGSCRRYKDKWFLLRNPFTAIKMAYYNEEVRQYVIRHYGPLDFNLSDGQPEESILMDEN